MSSGFEVEDEVLSLSNSKASSSANDSRLPQSSGTSAVYRPSGLLEDIEIAGVVALASDMGSQQKVSLFHNLQLKFSNLRPSSNEPAHLEKTSATSVHGPRDRRERFWELTCPHAEEVLDIARVDFMY